jgi:hypothetical protein
MTVGPETLRERMDVELLELQAVLLLKERVSALRGQQARMWELVSTVRPARKPVQWRLAPGACESRGLVEERQAVRREQQASPRSAPRERPAAEHRLKRELRKPVQPEP